MSANGVTLGTGTYSGSTPGVSTATMVPIWHLDRLFTVTLSSRAGPESLLPLWTGVAVSWLQ